MHLTYVCIYHNDEYFVGWLCPLYVSSAKSSVRDNSTHPPVYRGEKVIPGLHPE